MLSVLLVVLPTDSRWPQFPASDLFCVHFMEGLSNAEAHTLLRKANERLIARHFAVMLDNAKRAAWDLYEGGNAAFAGWRTT